MVETEPPLQRRVVGSPVWSSALFVTCEHVLGLVTVFLFTLGLWPTRVALRWLLQALMVLGFVHFRFYRHLGENKVPGFSRCAMPQGAANRITLARGWGVSCLAGLIFLPEAFIHRDPAWMSHIPGLLYLSIGCADFLDGLWARRTGTESELGKRLDVEMDALGLLVATCLGVWLKRLPLFTLTVGASYYLFQFGIWTRLQRGRIVLPLKDRPAARVMAGLNMGFVGAALLPLFAPPVLKLAAVCFSLPLLLGFLWDWLVVSGRLTEDRSDPMQRVIALTAEFLGLMMRVVVLVLGPVIAGTLLQSTAPAASLAKALLWVMIVLGWMGRSAALVSSCWMAHLASWDSASPLLLANLSAVIALTILGTGCWSLWKPEDTWLSRKMGSRSTMNTDFREGFADN